MTKNQWSRADRKFRIRRHILTGQALFAQGMALLQSIHADLADTLTAKHDAETMLQTSTEHAQSAHPLQ